MALYRVWESNFRLNGLGSNPDGITTFLWLGANYLINHRDFISSPVKWDWYYLLMKLLWGFEEILFVKVKGIVLGTETYSIIISSSSSNSNTSTGVDSNKKDRSNKVMSLNNLDSIALSVKDLYMLRVQFAPYYTNTLSNKNKNKLYVFFRPYWDFSSYLCSSGKRPNSLYL